MSAQYLVRFDDVCPTMNWSVWDRVEKILVRVGARPMLAVVPDNRDEKLVVGQAAEAFWDRVRNWQEHGWTIGMHGYQHLYSSLASGIVGIHRGSEFAGHPVEVQRAKLSAAIQVFQANRVRPSVWIAPGHAFDATTVRLLPEFGIKVVSDGFFWRPVERFACAWIPQQLWRFRYLSFGTWTVCFHINSWGESELRKFERDLERFAGSLTSVEAVLRTAVPPISVADRVFEYMYRAAVRLNAWKQSWRAPAAPI